MEHTILVVEDDQGIREAIGIYMENQGYEVVLAENGADGLEKMKTHPIHLAIVDIMMPVMDGIQMVVQARKTYDFPVIFLSAKSEDMDKINGLMIGADDYITKPFASMELIARVRAQLRRYEQILALQSGGASEGGRARHWRPGAESADQGSVRAWGASALDAQGVRDSRVAYAPS